MVQATPQVGIIMGSQSDWPIMRTAAETLDATAAHLFVSQIRIDNATAILDHPMFQQANKARIGIDLNIGAVNAVGENIRQLAHPEPARRR